MRNQNASTLLLKEYQSFFHNTLAIDHRGAERMYDFIEKNIVREDQSTLNYTWIRGKEEDKNICIMLPGLGYTTQGPLFYYSTNVCINNNLDFLHINYNYMDNVKFNHLSEHEQEKWMYADAKLVIETVLNDVEYEKYFFLGKSIGTIPMSYIWKEKDFINHHKIYGIWLTPLLKEKTVYDALLNSVVPSYFVIGNQDPYFSEELNHSLNNEQVSRLIIPNADHSLEIQGNIKATMTAAKQIIISIEDFIKKYK